MPPFVSVRSLEATCAVTAGALAGLLVASPAAEGARRFFVLHPGFRSPRIVAPPHPVYGRQPLYPAVLLPEPGYGRPFQSLPPPLPGNIIVEVPTRGPVPVRLDKIRDVGPYLTACWRMPTNAGRGLRQVTLRTGFKNSGALMGAPRMTYSFPPWTSGPQRVFVARSIQAFQRCTPLPLTVGFGNAIAGVPFAIRFTDTAG